MGVSMNKRFFISFLFIVSFFSLFALDQVWVSEALTWDVDILNDTVRELKREIRRDKENAELLARAGFCIHQLAQFSDVDIQDGIDFLEKSLEIKNDGLVQVFLGSSYTLRAKNNNSLEDIDKGMGLMDMAVKNNPDNENIRNIRLSNGIAESMPYFIFSKRKDIIEEDLNVLIALHSSEEGNEDVLSELYFKKGIFLLKNDDLQGAVDVWNGVLAQFPDSSGAVKSQEKVLIYNSY